MVVLNRWKQFKNSGTIRMYNHYYDKWYKELLRLTVNIFVWEGLPCPPAVMEEYLIYRGFAGLVRDKKEGLIVVTGGMDGVTNYYPVFTHMTYATPLTSGRFEIGVNGVICKANPLYETDTDCLDIYANLLAHADLTLQSVLVALRANTAFSASNQGQADTVRTWLKGIRNGKTDVIIDAKDFESIKGVDGVKTLPVYSNTNNTLSELYGVRQNLLRDFFTERGFLADKTKAERLVTDELSVNIYRTIYSIEDMIQERVEFCERANKMFGTNISVSLNPLIMSEINNIIGGGAVWQTSAETY